MLFLINAVALVRGGAVALARSRLAGLCRAAIRAASGSAASVLKRHPLIARFVPQFVAAGVGGKQILHFLSPQELAVGAKTEIFQFKTYERLSVQEHCCYCTGTSARLRRVSLTLICSFKTQS